jgi:hypothetical protein
MFRTPAFWIALTVLSVLSGIVALRLFPGAFPIVELDLTMDREAALAAARELSARERLGPASYREAASFATDSTAQTFIELEGGGKEVYADMLRQGLYAPYTWRVRHFQEGQKHEALIRFRADGRPYGFIEQIEETAPGAAASAEDARALAEREAARIWMDDLHAFTLVEQSREVRPQGRVDHTFTYERPSPTLNEGRYRLRLTVTGDRLTELTHFIRIPQTFSRRYEEMRAANEAIGAAGSIAMVVLYAIGGIGVGLFWLLRQHWVIARPAVKWGVGVAFLQLLAGINEFPLLWMSYDTAVSRASFLSQQITLLIASFAGFATLFSLSFMAAESLTRRAFGHHPQLWRVWSPAAAGSSTVLGQTLAGFFLVTMFFAYDVLLYYYATRWFGWWTPSEALIHPDILATYAPWLSAIANSLQAGFWEEALFRAVPIAGAALIGDRFGKRRLFIVIAFVIQTIVFGAGHAPYPTQPSYARPVELILPSIGFGLIYLRFGLLPGIILHYAFDVVWFALPLFVSNAAGIWIDRSMVIALTLVPLWVVGGAMLRAGRWSTLPDDLRNASWHPEAQPAPRLTEPEVVITPPIGARVVRTMVVAGLLSLVVWAFVERFRSPIPPLSVSREDAARIARDALASQGITLGEQWRVMAVPDGARTEAHQFVSDVAGDRFESLLGRYLPIPRWRVRVARFSGDLADRAEEWVVLVNHRGEAERIAHQLPESRPGASLSEEEARRRALSEVQRVLQVPAASLREVSARPSKYVARTDWTFTFQDLTVEPIVPSNASTTTGAANGDARAEARIEAVVAGDSIARVRPFVNVPEAWQREQRARNTLSQIVAIVATLIAAGALMSGAVTGVMAWSRRRGFSTRVLAQVGSLFMVASVFAAINRWPSTVAGFSTAQPFELQLAMFLGVGLVGLLLPGAAVALAAGAVPYDIPQRRRMTSKETVMLGAALGLLAAVVTAAVRASGQPPWPSVGTLAAYSPLAAAVLDPIPRLLLRSITLLALLTAVDDVTRGWTRHRAISGALLVVAGSVLSAPADPSSISQWLSAASITGVGLLAAYVLLLRHDLAMTPVAMGTLTVLQQIPDVGTSGAVMASLIEVAVTAIAAWWLFRLLGRERDAVTSTPTL